MHVTVKPNTCSECPLFVTDSGQYEENYCNHPQILLFPACSIQLGSDHWEWTRWYEERHPECPLGEFPITVKL